MTWNLGWNLEELCWPKAPEGATAAATANRQTGTAILTAHLEKGLLLQSVDEMKSPVDLENVSAIAQGKQTPASRRPLRSNRFSFRPTSWNRGRARGSDRIHQSDLRRFHGSSLVWIVETL